MNMAALSARSGGTLTLRLISVLLAVSITSGPRSVLNKQWLQEERINKNDGCPELGTEGRKMDEAWKS